MEDCEQRERRISLDDLKTLMDDPRLNYGERRSVMWAYYHIKKLETEKSWQNPYSRAISILESASRSFEGSYG